MFIVLGLRGMLHELRSWLHMSAPCHTLYRCVLHQIEHTTVLLGCCASGPTVPGARQRAVPFLLGGCPECVL